MSQASNKLTYRCFFCLLLIVSNEAFRTGLGTMADDTHGGSLNQSVSFQVSVANKAIRTALVRSKVQSWKTWLPYVVGGLAVAGCLVAACVTTACVASPACTFIQALTPFAADAVREAVADKDGDGKVGEEMAKLSQYVNATNAFMKEHFQIVEAKLDDVMLKLSEGFASITAAVGLLEARAERIEKLLVHVGDVVKYRSLLAFTDEVRTDFHTIGIGLRQGPSFMEDPRLQGLARGHDPVSPRRYMVHLEELDAALQGKSSPVTGRATADLVEAIATEMFGERPWTLTIAQVSRMQSYMRKMVLLQVQAAIVMMTVAHVLGETVYVTQGKEFLEKTLVKQIKHANSKIPYQAIIMANAKIEDPRFGLTDLRKYGNYDYREHTDQCTCATTDTNLDGLDAVNSDDFGIEHWSWVLGHQRPAALKKHTWTRGEGTRVCASPEFLDMKNSPPVFNFYVDCTLVTLVAKPPRHESHTKRSKFVKRSNSESDLRNKSEIYFVHDMCCNVFAGYLKLRSYNVVTQKSA